MRFQGLIVLPTIVCLAMVGSGCSLVVRPASDGSAKGNRTVPLVQEWPERLPATLPKLEAESGRAPVPQGAYGHCEVLTLTPEAIDPILLFASRSGDPVRSCGNTMDFTLTVDETNVSRFVSLHHRFTVVELESAYAAPVRGTVLYLGSIVGISRAEQLLLASLRRQGWNIIACLPPFKMSPQEDFLFIDGYHDLPGAAERFARDVENHIAERAFVAESAIAYLRKNRKDWLQGPLVLAGSSAGALALPAVVERVGPVDAAVLVGGGANIPEVLLRSSLDLMTPVMVEKAGGKCGTEERSLTDDEFERLVSLAFGQMRLDPAYLAPVLDETPTLLLLGRRDTIVPAGNGALLAGELSNPDVWKSPVGHRVLMVSLPVRAGDINRWINQRCPATVKPLPIPYEKRPKIRVRFNDNSMGEDGKAPVPEEKCGAK